MGRFTRFFCFLKSGVVAIPDWPMDDREMPAAPEFRGLLWRIKSKIVTQFKRQHAPDPAIDEGEVCDNSTPPS